MWRVRWTYYMTLAWICGALDALFAYAAKTIRQA